MNFLDSPLDVAAVNYLSFGFLTVVNNLWTWIAVLTAAVSFWKIRASGSSSVACTEEACRDGRSKRSASTSDPLLSPVPQSRTEDEVIDKQRKPVPEQTTLQVGRQVFDDDCVTQGKLTLYYYEENPTACSSEMMIKTEEEEEEEMEEQVEEQVEEGTEDDCEFMYERESLAWWQSWERTLRWRRGDNGWYRYQDLTVVNGNIVRFWEGSCSVNLVRHSPSCTVW